MASLSYGLNAGADAQVERVTVGSLAVTTNDVELRIDLTKNLTRKEVEKILHTFVRRLKDGRNADFNAI